MIAPLIWHIEKYLHKTGMAASMFGRESVRDPKLVFDLRKGREPGRRLSGRVEDYMEERGPDPVIRPVRVPAAPLRPQPERPFSSHRIERADVVRELRPVLAQMLGGQGHATLDAHRERSWASATFVGARHYWSWTVTGPDHDAITCRVEDQIGDHEFGIRGHLVADALVSERRATVREDGSGATFVVIEILTVEDA